MIHMNVLKYLWSDVVLSACYLINRMASSVLNKSSPFSCLYANKIPFFVTPCVFECTYFFHDLFSGLDKLSPRSIKCVFIGYFRTQKRYWCYNPSTRKYLVSVDVTFFESVPYFSTQVLSPYLRLFLHYLCHCLHLLIQLLCQCHQQKLQIHLHQSQFGISDTFTLIAQRFLPLNQFRLIPFR